MGNPAAPHQFQESGKSENATNATGNTEVGDNTNGGGESSGIKPDSLGDKNVNGVQNDFGSTRKNVAQTGIALGGADGSDKGKGKDELGGQKSSTQSEASNISNDCEKGGSLQHASQKDMGALGSYMPPDMGRQRLSEPDTRLPQHMLTQGQTNQMRPPIHSFSENIRPTMQQQPFGLYQSEMAPRTLAQNLPRPGAIRSDDGMIRPPMGGPLPGYHDTTMPPFAPENVGPPHSAGNSLEPNTYTFEFFLYCKHPDQHFHPFRDDKGQWCWWRATWKFQGFPRRKVQFFTGTFQVLGATISWQIQCRP